jgi:signal transduction histidine kinase
VKVDLSEFPGFYQLVVRDNGSVPPPTDTAGGGGLGLASMAERVRDLSGVLRTRWDQGFLIFVSIPKGS